MLPGLIWPLDWSCGGFVFVTVLVLACSWRLLASAARTAAAATKRAARSGTTKEVGKNLLEGWIVSLFYR